VIITKLKMELSYDPAVPLLGIHPKECRSIYNIDTGAPMFLATPFTKAKLWN
jgi:hypothetical protein